MKGKILAFVLLPILTGCLTSTVPEVTCWKIDYTPVDKLAAETSFGVARIAQVGVRSPYDGRPLAVLRGNGSLAFDPFNEFATNPSLLFKGVIYDALQQCGSFKAVVSPSSNVRNDVSVEAVFSNLYLDCREEGKRIAYASLELRIIGHDRSLVSIAKGEGHCDAADGNYTRAFSSAASLAIEKAIRQLK